MYTIDRAEYARGTRFVRDVRFSAASRAQQYQVSGIT